MKRYSGIYGPLAPSTGGGGSITPEQIQAAVDAYLTENPIEPGATEEQAEQIEKNRQNIELKLDKLQGAENSGKILGIGEDGNVIPVDAPSGGGSVETAIDHGTGDTTFELTPNVFHKWNKVATLALTLGAETPDVVNEYHFAFDSGSTATALSLPESVMTDITVEPNTHYECSIVDNYMVFNDWGLVNA